MYEADSELRTGEEASLRRLFSVPQRFVAMVVVSKCSKFPALNSFFYDVNCSCSLRTHVCSFQCQREASDPDKKESSGDINRACAWTKAHLGPALVAIAHPRPDTEETLLSHSLQQVFLYPAHNDGHGKQR